MSENQTQETKQQKNEHFSSMLFQCLNCNDADPIIATMMDYSGPLATGFFICPDCKNKFVVKIEDVGKVGCV